MRCKGQFIRGALLLMICFCLAGCGTDVTEVPELPHPTGAGGQLLETILTGNSLPVESVVIPELSETEQTELTMGEENGASEQLDATEPVKPSIKDDTNKGGSKPTVPKKPDAATEGVGDDYQVSGNPTVHPTLPEEETDVVKPTIQETVPQKAEEDSTDDENSTSETTVPMEIPEETEPVTEESSKNTGYGIELPDDDWG